MSGLHVNARNCGYEYDETVNITRITKNGTVEAEYAYDALDRLIKETRNGTATSWTYDANGNILTRTSTGTTVTYEYNGQSITYDAIGNPLTWGNRTFTWTAGRRLSSVTMPGKNISYTYGADGYRTSKTVNGVTTTYILDGGRISALKRGSDELLFVYDENGDVTGFYRNGAAYVYAKNLQGDVTGIIDERGAWVVSYEYDAWGKLLSTTGNLASTLGVLNPFRYRSYNYDDETGLYYLNSRYYDPEVGRFLNGDMIEVLITSPMGLTDKNLFAYCDDNPVIRADDGGQFWHVIVGAVIGLATQYVSDVVTNLIDGKSFAEALKPTSTWADYSAAALSGALAATGIGLGASVIANATISGATYLVNCSIKEEAANIVDFGLATGIGAVSGLVGGSGADGTRLRGVVKTSKNILKTAVSPKKIAMYSAKISYCEKTAIISGLRTVAAGFSANGLNTLRRGVTYSEV